MLYFRSSIVAILVGISAGEASPAEPTSEFVRLAAAVRGKRTSARPNAQAARAMDIVSERIGSILRERPAPDTKQIKRVIDRYARVADSGGGAPVTDFTWLDVRYASLPHRDCVAVTYGGLSRIAVYDRRSGKRIPLPRRSGWLTGWHSEPHFAKDGTLVLISSSVQDMGMRTAFRVDLLARGERGYRLVRTWQRMNTLDYGGAVLAGNRLILKSIDLPTSYVTAATETQFEREEVYRIAGGIPLLEKRDRTQPELRYLDRWMGTARAAKSPDPLQARFRRVSSKPDVLDSISISTRPQGVTEVRYAFNEGLINLGVRKSGARYRVVSVEHGRR
jgi:hypothetical protein